MKLKFSGKKLLGKTGNLITSFTILSTLSELDSLEKLVTFLSGLSEKLEQILSWIGMIANLIIGPWKNLIAWFFDLLPWSVPEEWQTYYVLFILSFQYPFMKLIQAIIEHNEKELQKKIDSIEEHILINPPTKEDYSKFKSNFIKFFSDNEVFSRLAGPITEYMIVVRSKLSKVQKDNVLDAAKRFIDQVKRNQSAEKEKAELKEELERKKLYFKISIVILILFILDKLQVGFSWDFAFYILKGILFMTLTVVVPIALFLLVIYLYGYAIDLIIAFINKFFPKKRPKLNKFILKKLFQSDIREAKKKNIQYAAVRANGQKVVDLTAYGKQLTDDDFQYTQEEFVGYENQ